MSIDLDMIQQMWEKDSKIDIDNLHTESLNIPILHAKYFDLYNQLNLLKKKAEIQRKKVRFEKYEYFTGKADPEVYIENPLDKKIRDKENLQGHLDSDEKLSQVTLKVDYYNVMIEYLQSILKQISDRNWQIKNALEFMRFSAGLG